MLIVATLVDCFGTVLRNPLSKRTFDTLEPWFQHANFFIETTLQLGLLF